MKSASKCLEDVHFAEEYVRLARTIGRNRPLIEACLYQGTLVDESVNGQMKQSRRLFEAATLLQAEPIEGIEAVDVLNRSLALWPENVDALSALRALHEARGDHEALIEVLSHELTLLLPGERRGRTAEFLLRLLEDSGAESERLSEVRAIALSDGMKLEPVEVSSVPEETSAEEVITELIKRGRGLMDAGGQVEEIAEVLEEALGLDPKADEAYRTLGELYRASDMPEQLSAILERHAASIGPRPRRAELWLERGRIALERLGSPTDALAAFERAVGDEAADDETTRAALTEALLVQGSHTLFPKFLESLSRRIDRQPGQPALLCLRAEFLQSTMQQGERAESDYQAALAADPNYGPAVLAVAQSEFASGHLHQALSLYRHALDGDVYPLEQRDRMVALVAAAKCFQQLSLLDELQDFALDVAVRYPDHAEIQRFVEEIAGVE